MAETKNLGGLADAIFAEIDRLQDPELTGDRLKEEITRAPVDQRFGAAGKPDRIAADKRVEDGLRGAGLWREGADPQGAPWLSARDSAGKRNTSRISAR